MENNNQDDSQNEESSEIAFHIREEGKQPIRVLVLDDERMVVATLKQVIQELLGYEVDVACSEEEGFQLYKEKLHQIIVLDIQLESQMSGVSLLKKIKSYDPIVHVIMITGYGTIDLAVECMRAGAWDFITKPFSYEHFEVVMKKAVENIRLKQLAVERDHFWALSRLDALTEVFNRRMFDQWIASEISRSHRHDSTFSLLMIDVDNFKRINDSGGHQLGDEVLKEVAYSMQQVSRGSDLLFRYGGDEFAVILPETNLEGSEIFAKRLKDELKRAHWKAKGVDESLPITLSIGIASYNSGSSEEIVECADRALAQAKSLGKDKIIPFPFD